MHRNVPVLRHTEMRCNSGYIMRKGGVPDLQASHHSFLLQSSVRVFHLYYGYVPFQILTPVAGKIRTRASPCREMIAKCVPDSMLRSSRIGSHSRMAYRNDGTFFSLISTDVCQGGIIFSNILLCLSIHPIADRYRELSIQSRFKLHLFAEKGIIKKEFLRSYCVVLQ